MFSNLPNFYEGEITEVKDDRVKVKIPTLEIEIPVYEAITLGYNESKSGYIAQLPKVGDKVLITFEGGGYHKPILLLGQKISIKELQKDKEFIKTKLFKIVPEKIEGPEEVVIDYENKQVVISSPLIKIEIDLNKGKISGQGGVGSFTFDLITGQINIQGIQVDISCVNMSIKGRVSIGSSFPLIKGPIFESIFLGHMHPTVGPIPGFTGPPLPIFTTTPSWTVLLQAN